MSAVPTMPTLILTRPPVLECPREIIGVPRWVLWRKEPRTPGAAPTKVPYQVDGQKAMANDPTTWTTFDAITAANESGSYAGIGFELGDGWIGGDLDDAFVEHEGLLKPWAATILSAFATYAEISPSGTGVKFLGRGTLTNDQVAALSGKKTGAQFKVDADGNPVKQNDPLADGAVELYRHGRFFAFTGNRFEGSPLVVNDVTAPFRALFTRLWTARTSLRAPKQAKVVGDYSSVPSSMRLKRCVAYITSPAFPRSVMGSYGSWGLFQAACETQRFALSDSEATEALHTYNGSKCDPAWADYEIDHKLDDAKDTVAGDGEIGLHLLTDRPQITPPPLVPSMPPLKPAAALPPCPPSPPPVELKLDTEAKTDTKPEPAKFPFLSAAKFAELDLRREYYIDHFFAAGPVPTIIAGAFKTLKTSIVMAMLIALAAGTRFLGHFLVRRAVRVAIMSGESGGFALQSLMLRISRAMGCPIFMFSDNFFICTAVPNLGNVLDLAAIEKFITDNSISVFVIDPAYLSMQGLRADDAGNLFQMAAFLDPLAAIGVRTGCTMVIVHHNSRGATRANPNEPAELADIAWGGFAEWAGQWVLLSRREKYNPDSNGEHRLWLTAGGRDGHSTLVGVNVTEGRQDDPQGRRWEVEVEEAAKARQATGEAERERREQGKAHQHAKLAEQYRSTVVGAMRKLGVADTKTAIRNRTGLSGTKFDPVLARLIDDGTVVAVDVVKNGQRYDGFQLAPGHTGTPPGQMVESR